MKRTNRALKTQKALEASIDKSVAILDAIHRAMCTCTGLPSNFVYKESDEADVARFLYSMKMMFESEVGKLDSNELHPFKFETVILGLFQYLNRFNESESTRQDKLVDSDDDGEQKNETIPTLEEDQSFTLYLGVEYMKVFSTISNANSPAVSVGLKEVPKKLRKLKSDVNIIKEELKKLMLGSDFTGYIRQLVETCRKTDVTERGDIQRVIAYRISQFDELYKEDKDTNFVLIDEIIEFLEKPSQKKEDGRRIFLVVFDKIVKRMSQILCEAMPIRLLSVLNHCLNEGIKYKTPKFFYSLPIGSNVTDALNRNDHASCVKVLRLINAMIKDFDQASSNRDLLHKEILKQYDTLEREVNNLRGYAQSLRNKIDQLEREVEMEKEVEMERKEVAAALNSNSYSHCSRILRRIEAMIEDFGQGSSKRSPQKFQKRYRIFKGRVEILKEQAQLLREKMRKLEVEEVVEEMVEAIVDEVAEEVSRRAILPT